MMTPYKEAAVAVARSNGLQHSVIVLKGKKTPCEKYVATRIWPVDEWGEPKPIIQKTKPPQQCAAPFMEISIFSRVTNTKATPRSLSRADFIKQFSKHDARLKKDGRMFSPATFNKTRLNSTFMSATGVCIDFDHGQPRAEGVTGLFPGVMLAVYSTFSHTSQAPRFRVVIPLSRPVDAEEHASLVRGIKSEIPPRLMECIDKTCFERARAHYLPSCPPENQEHAFTRHQDGEPLDVDHYIALGRESEPAAAEQIDNPPPPPAEVDPVSLVYEVADPATGEVIDLRVWAAQNPNFDIVAAIDPQYLRGNLRDGKQHIQCPFEDQHTDQEDDLATFVANASPPQYEAFDVHCCHAHCADRDRLEFIRVMLEKGWISFDQIQATAPPVVEIRRPRYVTYQTDEIMAAPEWRTLRQDERRIALDLMVTMWAEIDGMIADDDWMIARHLGLSEKEWMVYRETLTRTGWLIESDGRLTNGISKREFDHAQTALMNAVAYGALGGQKAASNRRSKK